MKRNLHMFKTGGQSVVISVVVGMLVALVVSVLLNIGLTSLVMNGYIAENGTTVFVFLSRAISVITGGLLTSSLAKEKILLVIGLSAVGYLMILIGLGIVLFEGSFHNFGSGVLSVAAGVACACIMKLKPPSKKKHSVKYRN